MTKLLPRSPYERLGGYVHLPRLIDKARLHRRGLLEGYNYKTVGFDKHLLAFLKLDPDAFEKVANEHEDDGAILAWVRKNGATHTPEEIEQWTEALTSRHTDTAVKKARFGHFVTDAGGAGREAVRTSVDLIAFD